MAKIFWWNYYCNGSSIVYHWFHLPRNLSLNWHSGFYLFSFFFLLLFFQWMKAYWGFDWLDDRVNDSIDTFAFCIVDGWMRYYVDQCNVALGCIRYTIIVEMGCRRDWGMKWKEENRREEKRERLTFYAPKLFLPSQLKRCWTYRGISNHPPGFV